MPTTRLQSQQVDERRSRGTRKRRSMVVASFESECFEFFKDILPWGPEDNKASGKSRGQFATMTSARTRVYTRPEGKALENVVRPTKKKTGKECPGKVGKRTVKKAAWVTHELPVGVESLATKSSQDSGPGIDTESESDRSGTVESKSREKSPRVPLYLLNPDSYQENPVEKERIMKSKYDKQRRDNEMKAKVSQLKQENLYLKQLLGNTSTAPGQGTEKSQGPTGVSYAKQNPVFNKGVPCIIGPGQNCRPRPVLKMSLGRPLKSPQNNPNDIYLNEKRRILALSRLHKMVEAARELEKEKSLIKNLYQQQSENDKDDEDALLEAICGADLTTAAESNKEPGTVLEKARDLNSTDSSSGSTEEDDEIIVIGYKFAKKPRLSNVRAGRALQAV